MLPATIHVWITVLCLSKRRATGHWESRTTGTVTRLLAANRALQVYTVARLPRLRSTQKSAQRASTFAVWRLMPGPRPGLHVTRSDYPMGTLVRITSNFRVVGARAILLHYNKVLNALRRNKPICPVMNNDPTRNQRNNPCTQPRKRRPPSTRKSTRATTRR